MARATAGLRCGHSRTTATPPAIGQIIAGWHEVDCAGAPGHRASATYWWREGYHDIFISRHSGHRDRPERGRQQHAVGRGTLTGAWVGVPQLRGSNWWLPGWPGAIRHSRSPCRAGTGETGPWVRQARTRGRWGPSRRRLARSRLHLHPGGGPDGRPQRRLGATPSTWLTSRQSPSVSGSRPPSHCHPYALSAACADVSGALVYDLRRDRLIDDRGSLQVPSMRELAGDSPLLLSGSPRQVQQRSSQRRFRTRRVAPRPRAPHSHGVALAHDGKSVVAVFWLSALEHQIKTLRGRALRVGWRGACQARGRR